MVSVWQVGRGPRDKMWDLVALAWQIRSRVITTSSALAMYWNFFGGPSVGFKRYTSLPCTATSHLMDADDNNRPNAEGVNIHLKMSPAKRQSSRPWYVKVRCTTHYDKIPWERLPCCWPMGYGWNFHHRGNAKLFKSLDPCGPFY